MGILSVAECLIFKEKYRGQYPKKGLTKGKKYWWT